MSLRSIVHGFLCFFVLWKSQSDMCEATLEFFGRGNILAQIGYTRSSRLISIWNYYFSSSCEWSHNVPRHMAGQAGLDA